MQKSGVILSKDGHAYLPYLKSVQASLANLRTKKQEMKGLDQAILRIGTFTSISVHVILDFEMFLLVKNILPHLIE